MFLLLTFLAFRSLFRSHRHQVIDTEDGDGSLGGTAQGSNLAEGGLKDTGRDGITDLALEPRIGVDDVPACHGDP